MATEEGESGTAASGRAPIGPGSVERVGGVRAHQTPLAATLTALRDLLRPRRDVNPPHDDLRLEGRHVLVTGASRGLGRAIARDLARRGATLTLVARAAPLELASELVGVSGAPCRALGCELSDLRRVVDLTRGLGDGPVIDTVVLNAGLMPSRTRLTPQGYEEMFAVHFAANVVLVERLLSAGLLRGVGVRPDHAGVGSGASTMPATLVVVSSEAHRSSPEVDREHFELPPEFGMTDGMKWYGHSKLLFLSWALRLARLHASGQDPTRADALAVHALCPGPIASNIAREAPLLLRPLLVPVMRLFFNSPETARIPVMHFVCEPSRRATTGDYLHMRAEKIPDPRALDPVLADTIDERARRLFAPFLSD